VSSQILNEVSELIKYVLFSDYIVLDLSRHETSVSAAIIADPESGKTSIVDQFIPSDGILYLTDVTAWGLQHNYIEQLKRGEFCRILIPDLINPINRKQETVDSLITFFNSYISWEGVSTIMTYAMQVVIDPPIKGSLLTTIATQDFHRMVKKLAAVGFISRLLLIGYEYDKADVDNILTSIARSSDSWQKNILKFPNEKVDIGLQSDFAEMLIPMAKDVGKQAGAYGFRAQHQFMTLAKCKALSEGRTSVNAEDITRLSYLLGKFVFQTNITKTKKGKKI